MKLMVRLHVVFHGVLFRGNAGALIRKELVKSDCHTGLPNLFFGTSIPHFGFRQENARKGIFMIDARKILEKMVLKVVCVSKIYIRLLIQLRIY